MKQALLTFLLILVHVKSAVAIETPPQCSEKTNDDSRLRALAGQWFTKAEALVAEERFQEALDAFVCSFKMVPHPDTAFNAAAAAKRARNCDLGFELANKYLEMAPEGPVANDARQLIAEFETCRTEKTGSTTTGNTTDQDTKVIEDSNTPKPETARPSNDVTPAPSELNGAKTISESPEITGQSKGDGAKPTRRASILATAGYITFGIGGAGVIAGAVLQGLASNNWAEGESTDSYHEFQERRDKLHIYQTGALVGLIAGGLVTGAGIALIIISRKNSGEDRLAMGPGSNGVIIEGHF